MIWFWKREQAEMRLETRYDNATHEFVVVLTSDGGAVTERFSDITSFKARLVALEQQLHSDKWKNSGPPLFIPEGFPSTNRLRTRD